MQGQNNRFDLPSIKGVGNRNGLPLVRAGIFFFSQNGAIVRSDALSRCVDTIEFVAAGRPLNLAAAEKPEGLEAPETRSQPWLHRGS